jgi:hypothetical protein
VLEVGYPQETLKLDDLLELLPSDLRTALRGVQNDTVDVALAEALGKNRTQNCGTRPTTFCPTGRSVKYEDAGHLHDQLEGRIMPKIRAGLPQSLHRISFM